ncbi:Fe-S cluster assembly ATPase SufC [Candidatus Gottesmanbacteria bacterium RBG_16_52_11]|uniref:Fe-S cluster assembly ATPase SufC n=1 Tax=Candidatus Gottesmanbacteria bacterium RBG_16_52_11 TaxID=1798374 RepID=A0A1F5YMM6_9BACT|nr:MAG: Fe-S cluster assembly ATPase SufC [Candidatus Gottesmanbacteria bacterium RBG_16_52_11]
MLSLNHISAGVAGKNILRNVTIRVAPGEVHAVMGPNGSGKSTLASVTMGSPVYALSADRSGISIGKAELTGLPAEERARRGLFLAFQSPAAVPGVSVMQLLRAAYQELHSTGMTDGTGNGVQNPVLSRRWKAADTSLVEFSEAVRDQARALDIDEALLNRGINDGFSGGERKKMEILQALVLKPKFAIFDEIDTGLDVDALRIVAAGIRTLRRRGTGCIIITHYLRILRYIRPDRVHVIVGGRLIRSGGWQLARQIEKRGYADLTDR